MSATRTGNALVALLVIVALVGAAAFFLYRYKDRLFRRHEPPKIIVPTDFTPVTNAAPKVEKPVEEPPPPPPPKVKTVAELKAEADAARAAFRSALAAQRKGTASLKGFAGLRFGEPLAGVPVYTETRAEGCVSGLVCAVAGPTLDKPFRSFGNRPLVWVTPKTRRIWRIEFSRDLKPGADGAPDPEMTNTVALLAARFKRAPVAVDVPLADRESAFGFGDTTLTVGEYGGSRLRLVVEHAGIASEIASETEALRKEELAEPTRAGVLKSTKYPNGGRLKGIHARVKNATPQSFCGVVFASTAPHGAHPVDPRNPGKGFYLDYRTAKISPFMGFDHGKAEVGLGLGGVYAVNLYSDGPVDGLDDAAYYARVRKAIESAYKLKATETPSSDGAFPACSWTVGDLDVRLAPDPRGGYALSAVHRVYETLWK